MRGSRWSLLKATLLALVVSGFVAVAAYAQANVMRRIVVEGNQRVETSTVESYLMVRPGDTIDAQKLNESLKNLTATGLFEDVRIDLEGDALVIKVKENPIINEIAFEGNKRLEDKVLRDEIQLQPRQVFTRSRVQNAVNRILELYRRNGRYAAKVEPKSIQLDQNRVNLVFEISEGPRTGVAAISFIGNNNFSDGTLRGVIQTTESAWYKLLTSNDTYDPDRLNFDQELLRRFYFAHGYADFQVISAIAELAPDGSSFYITFTVDEGPQFTFGKVDVASSVKDLHSDQLVPLLETRSGTVYNADQIENTVQKLTDEVGKLGYAFVQIDPQIRKNEAKRTVDLVYKVDEGPRVYVERINISGNVRTLDEVIRREFRLSEGDAFNTALLRRSQQRLRNLGFFDTVDIKTLQGSAPDKVIIDVHVAERSTGELSFGAGYSTSDGVLGDITLKETNLLGRGQDLQANVTLSQKRQYYNLSFTEPYFLNRELAAGFDLFRTKTDYQSSSSFDESNTGLTLRLGYPLTESLTHQIRYTIRNDAIQNVDRNASIFIRNEEGDRYTSLVGQSFTYDKRDTRFLPTEGYFLKLDQDLAGLGGDNRFLRHEAHASYYYPFSKNVVLNVGANGGYIFGFGGETVHIANRFFLGGESLRGFQYGGIGPRDKDTDDSLGGNGYYTGSAELRFPLGLPEDLRIFGRTFVDAGTLTGIDVHGPSLQDTGDIRVGAGVGLSWLSPLGPLAIDLAQALVKDSGDKTETFRLSFGTRF